MRWTDEQWRAIDRPPASAVVYAAPGSGKTSVIVEHIAQQLLARRVPPAGIMAVTFTRQAATEMRTRLHTDRRLSTAQTESLRIGTFHALLFSWLARSGLSVRAPLEGHEQRALARAALRQAGIHDIHRLPLFLNWLTRYRSSWPEDAGFLRRAPSGFPRALRHYESMKDKMGRWDFDDIPRAFSITLDQRPDRLFHRHAPHYLVVDEFQDTNALEWHIVERLARVYDCPVFTVGDDDQSIYGFRGASPRWLLEFHTAMRAEAYLLTTNFRSDTSIVAAANRLIRHNRIRVPKRVRPFATEPGWVHVQAVANAWEEAERVRHWLVHVQAKHPEWTVAVMARTRKQLLQVWRTCARMPTVEWRTFHDSKGREWDAVAILGAVEPNPALARQPDTDADWEEERRLFYVALTRARHVCAIWAPRHVEGVRVRPVRFLEELSREAKEGE